jgi:predicted nuclease of predicted toxin-antitoxin system
MARFLIDVNLPYYFSLWHNAEYLHLKDFGDEWSDFEVWKYARREELTIVTKDADFSTRAILEPPPPRVIHIRLGNMRMRQFHRVLSELWPEVCELSSRYRLIQLFEGRIEGIE